MFLSLSSLCLPREPSATLTVKDTSKEETILQLSDTGSRFTAPQKIKAVKIIRSPEDLLPAWSPVSTAGQRERAIPIASALSAPSQERTQDVGHHVYPSWPPGQRWATEASEWAAWVVSQERAAWLTAPMEASGIVGSEHNASWAPHRTPRGRRRPALL